MEPEITLTRVLLPAPFSPINAWTSPRRTSRATSWSARVAPNLFPIAESSRRLSTTSPAAQILRERGTHEPLDPWLVPVCRRHHRRAGIHSPGDRLSIQVIDDRLDAELAHA